MTRLVPVPAEALEDVRDWIRLRLSGEPQGLRMIEEALARPVDDVETATSVDDLRRWLYVAEKEVADLRESLAEETVSSGMLRNELRRARQTVHALEAALVRAEEEVADRRDELENGRQKRTRR